MITVGFKMQGGSKQEVELKNGATLEDFFTKTGLSKSTYTVLVNGKPAELGDSLDDGKKKLITLTENVKGGNK